MTHDNNRDRPPGVLFLCVHNAGRSQLAAAMMSREAGPGLKIFSGGSEPAEQVHPIVKRILDEEGFNTSELKPQIFTSEMLAAVDVVVSMGCGDTCPYIPGKRYLDWPIEDPKEKSYSEVLQIAEDIRSRVQELARELRPAYGLGR